MNNLRKNKKGFTLIELVVVITIIIILALVAIPIVGQLQTSARQAAMQTSAETIFSAAQVYQTDRKVMQDTGTNPLIATNNDLVTTPSGFKNYVKIDTTVVKSAVATVDAGGTITQVVVTGTDAKTTAVKFPQ